MVMVMGRKDEKESINKTPEGACSDIITHV